MNSTHKTPSISYIYTYILWITTELNQEICLQIAYTEEYEQQKGKGSFPAMITPGYHLAKKAQDYASDVSMNLNMT